MPQAGAGQVGGVGGGSSGVGGSGGGGSSGDSGADKGDEDDGFKLQWKGWSDRVAADPDFPFKVFTE